MSFFYGWVIVAVGIVVSCIGMGGVMSLGVFLEPMADTLGWSRAGISTASTLAFSMRLNGRYVFRKRVLSFGSGDIGSVGMSHQSAYVFPQHISFRRGTPCFSLQFALMTI